MAYEDTPRSERHFILWKSITFLLLIVGGEVVVQMLLLKLENKKKD